MPDNDGAKLRGSKVQIKAIRRIVPTVMNSQGLWMKVDPKGAKDSRGRGREAG